MSPRLSWPRPPLDPARPEPVVPEAVHRRLAFASARTREVWAPRLASLTAAALATELHLIATGALDAALIWTPYADLADLVAQIEAAQLAWKARQPVLRAIDSAGLGPDPALLTQMTYPILVSRRESDPAALAIDAEGGAGSARAFGYPPCCAAARAERLAAGIADPLAALLADPGAAGQPLTSGVMLGALGFGPVRHMPCDPDCAAARALARDFVAAMAQLGFADAEWLAEMMQWRVRASLIGGVAQIETGAFRFAWRASLAGTGGATMVSGAAAPRHAPAGLSSIFSPVPAPARRRAVPARAESVALDGGFAEAGFASPFALRSRWSALLWEQARPLRKARTVLQPGCGSGLLLELLVQSHPKLRVCGIEADAALAARARARLDDGATIVNADWMAEALQWGEERGSFDLALLDPEPLIDLPANRRRAVVAGLAAVVRSIVLVASDRALRRFGTVEAMAGKLEFAPVPGRASRISCMLARAVPAVAMA